MIDPAVPNETREQNRIAIVIGVFAILFVLYPHVNQSTDEIKLLFYLTALVAMFYGLYLFFIALAYTPESVGRMHSKYFNKFKELAYFNYFIGSYAAFLFMAVIVVSLIFGGVAKAILGFEIPLIIQQILLILLIAVEAIKIFGVNTEEKTEEPIWSRRRRYHEQK
ncbi:MAG: hypothetical protein Q8P05_06095 [Candidatus Diapherotrites archaeon]|nr:hypothetical protein [Candidatus Diapherotrites archaeon]